MIKNKIYQFNPGLTQFSPNRGFSPTRVKPANPVKDGLARTVKVFRNGARLLGLDLTRFNKIAIQGTPQMAVDKEAISLSRVYLNTILSVPAFILCVTRLN